jgi:hypothetical protein
VNWLNLISPAVVCVSVFAIAVSSFAAFVAQLSKAL